MRRHGSLYTGYELYKRLEGEVTYKTRGEADSESKAGEILVTCSYET